MAKTTKQVEFVAYADFDWSGKHYEAGDAFSPVDMVRDAHFEAFRNAENKKKLQGDTSKLGIPFTYEKEVAKQRNPETDRMEPVIDTFRVILPVQEKASE
jgi:hypothetical protein